MLIFAFGSNLSRDQMIKRCPGATVVGPAMLDDHRLAFGSHSAGWRGGVATVVRAKGHKVRGVIYHLNDREVARLDGFEGTPFQYKRVSGRVRWDRKVVTASWYVLNNKPFAAPSARYLATIAVGYNRYRFSKKALYKALRYTRDRMLKELKRQRAARARAVSAPRVASSLAAPLSSRQIEMWTKRHGVGSWWDAKA